jgi:hypothetical protein
MLAQLPTISSGDLGGWLIAAAAVLVIAERGFAFWKNHLREQPPPSQTYMTKTDCHLAHAATKEELKRLADDVEHLKAARSETNNVVAAATENLRREMNESFRRVHQRIDELPDKIIAILANTKALRE